MRHTLVALSLSCALGAVGALAALGCNDNKRDRPVDAGPPPPPTDAVAGAVPDPVKDFASAMIDSGRKTFRFDTFGDEAFWGTSLQLHRAVAGTANGGVGAGVSPKVALSVGLKVDVDALPAETVTA